MSDINYERRKAVANAWKNERNLVKDGSGTRDWTVSEQREILLTGKAKGYEGHHMRDVSNHNSLAGDPNNIQFLNRKEHLQAHGGDFHNKTNGYFDPKTNEMHEFGRNKPHIESQKLNNPLDDSSKNRILRSIDKSGEAKKDAASYERRSVNKSIIEKPNSDKKTDSKTLSNQRTNATVSNKRKTESKTLEKQRYESLGKNNSQSASKSNSKGVKKGH